MRQLSFVSPRQRCWKKLVFLRGPQDANGDGTFFVAAHPQAPSPTRDHSGMERVGGCVAAVTWQEWVIFWEMLERAEGRGASWRSLNTAGVEVGYIPPWFDHTWRITLRSASVWLNTAQRVQLQCPGTSSKEQNGRHQFSRNLGSPECTLLLTSPYKGRANTQFSMDLYN